MKIGICKTILALNSTAQVSCSGEDVNTLIWHDGNPTNITNEQILAKQQELQIAADNSAAQEQANKQSAFAKLKTLGLTDAEITALIGS
jgi:hypothetical protein